MLKKINDNFKKGLDRLKWFSSLFSERIKVEIAVIKLLFQSDKMNRQKDEYLKIIGQRIVELKGHAEKNIFKDEVIMNALDEIGNLQKNIDELKQKASEISRVEE